MINVLIFLALIGGTVGLSAYYGYRQERAREISDRRGDYR